jgi:hypothetical protein
MIFPVPVKTVIITRAYSTSILNSIAIELASDAPFNVIENIKATTNDVATGSLMHPDITILNHFDGIVFWMGMTYVFIRIYLNKYELFIDDNNNDKHVEQLYKFVEYQEISRQTKQFVFLVFYIFFKNVCHCT